MSMASLECELSKNNKNSEFAHKFAELWQYLSQKVENARNLMMYRKLLFHEYSLQTLVRNLGPIFVAHPVNGL